MLRQFKTQLKTIITQAQGRLPKNGPDFFIVGATRAGTTYLHHLLNNHPDIFMPKGKELHYFNHDGKYNDKLKGYLPLFNGYKNEKAIGEATPLYCEKGTYFDKDGIINFFRDETTIQRIKKHYPDAKLIISLRDPVTRIISLQKKNYFQGKVKTKLSEEIRNELEGQSRLNLLYRNRFDIHLQEIYKHFSKEFVHIMVFEEWIEDIDHSMNTLMQFLDIAPLEKWPVMPDKKNTAGEYKRKNAKKENNDNPIDMDDALQNLIIEELSPSRVYLEELLGRSLPWAQQT